MRTALALLMAVAGLGAEEAPPALDQATIERAEAAVASYDETADGAQAEPEAMPTLPASDGAVPLDDEQRDQLAQVGVLLLEAKTHLGIGQGAEAGDRYLEAQAILVELPLAVVDGRAQAELARCREQLVVLGRRLLDDGHLGLPPAVPQDESSQGLGEEEAAGSP